MDLDSGAGLLHRLTCYTPDREWDVRGRRSPVAPRPRPNDPDALRPPAEGVPRLLPVVELPRDLPDPG